MIRTELAAISLLPGLPRDYRDGPVHDPVHLELANEPDTQAAVLADEWPLPTATAREGYFGEQHYEYWLSGRQTMKVLRGLLPGTEFDRCRALDFGGASARVIRHFATTYPGGDWYLCDINFDHILLVNRAFPGIKAFANSYLPALPFESRSLDFITALSVFTHIDQLEIHWLLELRRCLKPGGSLYISLHNDDTWRNLPTTFVGEVVDRDPDFAEYYDRSPELTERVAAYYNEAESYNCNVFHPNEYLHRVWAPHFQRLEIFPSQLQYQSGVLMVR